MVIGLTHMCSRPYSMHIILSRVVFAISARVRLSEVHLERTLPSQFMVGSEIDLSILNKLFEVQIFKTFDTQVGISRFRSLGLNLSCMMISVSHIQEMCIC